MQWLLLHWRRTGRVLFSISLSVFLNGLSQTQTVFSLVTMLLMVPQTNLNNYMS